MPLRWWKVGPRIPGLLLFGLVALSLLGGMAAVFFTLRVEAEERAQVTLTNTVLAALRDSSRAIIDAETGQRGYIITQDPDYLTPYLRGKREWPLAQERLEASLEGIATQEQAELIASLRSLAEFKLAELSETVEQVENGDIETARRRVLTDEGRAIMVQYRAAVERLEQIEENILEQSRAQANLYESRIVPILFLLAIIMVAALALGIWQMVRIARAEALAASAGEIAEQRDRADLISRELNHRVQNLFAVVLAIVQMSLRNEKDARLAADKIIERIQALSTAHRVTQGRLEKPIAELHDLVRTAIAPYEGPDRIAKIEGPQISVAAAMVTPLGLILHELVTNCVKYGAWSGEGGELSIRWEQSSKASTGDAPEEIHLHWYEAIPGGLEEPQSSGYGTRMIKSSARQLRGNIEREFGPDGLRIKLSFLPA